MELAVCRTLSGQDLSYLREAASGHAGHGSEAGADTVQTTQE